MQTEYLYDGLLRIDLPDSFGVMSEETARRIYPMLERPESCFIDESGGCSLTFSLLEGALSKAEVLPAAKGIRRMLQSLYPGSMLTDVFPRTASTMTGAGFAFRSNSLNGPIYCTMYVFSLEGQFLLCTTNCPLECKDSKNMMREIIASMQPLEAD